MFSSSGVFCVKSGEMEWVLRVQVSKEAHEPVICWRRHGLGRLSTCQSSIHVVFWHHELGVPWCVIPFGIWIWRPLFFRPVYKDWLMARGSALLLLFLHIHLCTLH